MKPCCLLSALLLLVSARADEYDTLRAKWCGYLNANNSFTVPTDPNDPLKIGLVALADGADANWGHYTSADFSQQVFDNVPLNLTDPYQRASAVNKTYLRLLVLAKAWATQGTTVSGTPSHSGHATLYNDSTLLSDLKAALDGLNQYYYNSSTPLIEDLSDPNNPKGNSGDFYLKIGIPQSLCDMTTLLYDQLTTTQRSNYLAAVGHFMNIEYSWGAEVVEDAGANRVWECELNALHGVLSKTAGTGTTSDLYYARDHLSEAGYHAPPKKPTESLFTYIDPARLEVNPPSGETSGFYSDGSFIQHDRFSYAGGYGVDLIHDLAHLLALLKGSTWEVTETTNPGSGHVTDWVYDSYEPIIYRGAAADMTRGRKISYVKAYDVTEAFDILGGILRYANDVAPTADAAAFKSSVKAWLQAEQAAAYSPSFFEGAEIPIIILAQQLLADSAVLPRNELIGHYAFTNMDRVMHLRPGFGLGLAMWSNRIYNYETLKPTSPEQTAQNKKGWFTADGATTLYLPAHLDQFSNAFWPTINPYRLPGTTVDTLAREDQSSAKRLSALTWIGSAALDYYGVTGMDFRAANHIRYDGTLLATIPLVAKKSWFFFDDEIVCLGAGITGPAATGTGWDGAATRIETIVENRRLDAAGDNTFKVNNTDSVTTLTTADPGTPVSLSSVTTAHLAGNDTANTTDDTGYYFPTAVSLKAIRQQRTKPWSEIYGDPVVGEPTYTNNFLTLWFDHGALTSGSASYAYALLPGKSAAQTVTYGTTPDIAVVNNTSTLQAVKEKVLGLTAANFWSDTAQTTAPGTGTDGVTLTSDKKAAVILDDNPPGFTEISVADPTRANTGSINIEFNKAITGTLSADAGIAITQLSPTAKFSVAVNAAHGHPFRARFFTGSPDLIVSNFNSDTTGGSPAGWTVSATGGTVSVVGTPSATDKGVRVNDTSTSAGPNFSRSFTAQNAPITVEFDALAEQTTSLLEIGSLYQGSTQAVGVYFRGTGKIAYYDSTGALVETSYAYAANTWYRFRIVARADSRKFDLYVNDTALLTNMPFRTGVPLLDKVRFGGTNTTTGAMVINNVTVRQLTSLVEQAYDSETIGAAPASWTISGSGTGASVTIQNSPSGTSGDLAMKIDDNSTTTALTATRTFAAQTGAFVTELRITPSQTNRRITVALTDGTNDCVLLYLYDTGVIRYYNGATLSTTDAYTANTPLDIRLAADPLTDTYDLYLNGVRKVAGAAFKTTATSLQTLKFVTLQASDATTAYIDNVRLYR